LDHAGFWGIIDEARAAKGRRAATLTQILARYTREEIAEFNAWFRAYYRAIDRQDLWAAVYAIRGGCGDDSFDYFRGWLISRGEGAIIEAINDPESLVQIIGKSNPHDEHMLRAAEDAYRAKTGKELPDSEIDVEIPGRSSWPADRVAYGLRWNDAFYAGTYPKLHARYFANLPPLPTGAISHARFWRIIDEARVSGATVTEAVAELAASLSKLATPELIGFDRWLTSYNNALIRDELRAVSRVLLGKSDVESVADLRGWLILQGEEAVRAATREPDTLLDHATHSVAACRRPSS
jgi:hypothetical protein